MSFATLAAATVGAREIRILIELPFVPALVAPELREHYLDEAEFAGFAREDENAAWFLAEDVAADACLRGVTVVVVSG